MHQENISDVAWINYLTDILSKDDWNDVRGEIIVVVSDSDARGAEFAAGVPIQFPTFPVRYLPFFVDTEAIMRSVTLVSPPISSTSKACYVIDVPRFASVFEIRHLWFAICNMRNGCMMGNCGKQIYFSPRKPPCFVVFMHTAHAELCHELTHNRFIEIDATLQDTTSESDTLK